jgi:hypothetical protein
LYPLELFSTTAVENAVEIFSFMWKKVSKEKFSTFPQGTYEGILWKCGKLLSKSLTQNNLMENRAVENYSPQK